MPENRMTIEEMPLAAVLVEKPKVAVGIKLARLQYLTQVMGDENAPHFSPGQEPTQDGKAYRATDGRYYYRPNLRVAQRALPPLGPDVRFLKDADGAVRLQFELEESPEAGLPAGAEPFDVRVDSVTLQWRDEGGQTRQRIFDQPTLVGTDDPQDSTSPNFSIRVGAQLNPEEVQPIYHAMSVASSRATLSVQLSFGYWSDEAPSPPHNPGGVVIRPRPPIIRLGASSTLPTHPPASSTTPTRGTTVPRLARVIASLPALRTVDSKVLGTVLEKAKERERQSDFHTVTLTRSVPFGFDPALETNRPIYAAIEGEQALADSWTDTGFGLVRSAPFANTVYRLPDEIRLAYNGALGAPHVVPTLYRDTQEEIRVRVTLGAIPWHDPEQIVKLRDFLLRTSAGALASPQVVIGGYEQASLQLTSAFPEQIHVMAGEEIQVSLDKGFQITMDLSLEFYRFLAELLTGPLGLTGEVTVALDTVKKEGEPPQAQTRRVPMRLSLGDLAGLPVQVKVADDAVSPRQLQLINQASDEMSIGDCLPRLLQYDANSAVPLEVFEAMATAPAFPATLPVNGGLAVEVKPKEEASQDELWNAVQVELVKPKLTKPAKEVLDRIHEIAPNGTLAWKLSVEAPVFTREPVPSQFQNIFRLRVKISRSGYTPQYVDLGPGKATGQVTMQRTLNEILREDALSIPTFSYQVQNVYFDHEGRWGEEKSGEGSNLYVFPNPVDGD